MGEYKKTKLIFLGPPGAGKGTTSTKVAEVMKIPHISTGEIFRKHIKEKTELGRLAEKYIHEGLYVPDEVTIKMVFERLRKPDCKEGFILDGFPRNIAQAEALKNSEFEIDLVPNLVVSEETLIQRLSHRLTCHDCPETYNTLTVKPKKEGVCDKCGGELYQRVDDRPEVIQDRLKVYYEHTEQLIGYYKEKGLLKEIDASRDIPTIVNHILEVLKE